MSARPPLVLFLSDGLEAPPRHGYMVHVLALARAASRHATARAFAWVDADSDGWRRWREANDGAAFVEPLDRRSAPRGWRRKFHYLDRALAWFREHAGDGSVIWVRSYSTALLLLPRLKKLRRAHSALRVVYDASSFLRLEAPHTGPLQLYDLRGRIEERLWKHFDLVRTLNEPMRDYLVAHGVRPERIVVLPVGAPDQAPARPDRASAQRLLYVGSGMGWQGLAELTHAMERLAASHPQATLTVVGEAQTAGNGSLPANVRLRGAIPHQEVGAVYGEHDLLVLPRPRTALTDMVLPMKIPEAMAHGMPILATDLAAVRAATGPDAALFAADNRPETLARAIAAALDDPQRLRDVGTRARERAREFSWNRLGERIRDEVLAARPRPA